MNLIGNRSLGLLATFVVRCGRFGVVASIALPNVAFADHLRAGIDHRVSTALGQHCLQLGMHDAAAGNAVVDIGVVSFHVQSFNSLSSLLRGNQASWRG